MDDIQLVQPNEFGKTWASATSGFNYSRPMSQPKVKYFFYLLERYLDGDQSAGISLQEAMTTSDFPLLYGDILQIEMLNRFQALDPMWPAYCRAGFVNDFRQARRLAYDGIDGVFYPGGLTPEATGHIQDNNLVETGYITQVAVYAKGFCYSWQMTLGDIVNMLSELPSLLGVAARRSEEFLATSLLVDSNGPISPFFSAGNGNIITGNPALSITGVKTAMEVAANQTDSLGEPILFDAFTLLVPRQLQFTALEIINATSIEFLENSSSTIPAGDRRFMTRNWLANNITVVVNPYLDRINTLTGNTTWFLIANPRLTRPSLEVTKLTGFDAPRIYRKMPNLQQMGMTSPDMSMGDFDTLQHEFKVIYPLGGTRLEPRTAFASNGTNV